MSKKAFHQLLKRYLDGHCVQEEKEIVEQWYTQLRRNKHSEFSPAQLDATEQKIWRKIESGVDGLRWSEMVLAKALQPSGPSRKRIVGLVLFILLILVIVFVSFRYFNSKNPVDAVAPELTMAAIKSNSTGILIKH